MEKNLLLQRVHKLKYIYMSATMVNEADIFIGFLQYVYTRLKNRHWVLFKFESWGVDIYIYTTVISP